MVPYQRSAPSQQCPSQTSGITPALWRSLSACIVCGCGSSYCGWSHGCCCGGIGGLGQRVHYRSPCNNYLHHYYRPDSYNSLSTITTFRATTQLRWIIMLVPLLRHIQCLRDVRNEVVAIFAPNTQTNEALSNCITSPARSPFCCCMYSPKTCRFNNYLAPT